MSQSKKRNCRWCFKIVDDFISSSECPMTKRNQIIETIMLLICPPPAQHYILYCDIGILKPASLSHKNRWQKVIVYDFREMILQIYLVWDTPSLGTCEVKLFNHPMTQTQVGSWCIQSSIKGVNISWNTKFSFHT